MKKQLSILVMEKEISQYHQWKSFLNGSKFSLEWVYDPGDFVRSVIRKRAMGERYDFIFCGLFIAEKVTGLDLWNLYRNDGELFILFSGLSRREIDEVFLVKDEPLFLQRPWTSQTSQELILKLLEELAEEAA